MKIEFTEIFDKNFSVLSPDVQQKARRTVEIFADCYASRRFPKSLRVHRCGPFLSLSVSMKHRIFVLPIVGGIRFAFVGDHQDAGNYLKK